jgi:hypothetical protein
MGLVLIVDEIAGQVESLLAPDGHAVRTVATEPKHAD